MNIYEKAKACIPMEEWDEIIKEWKEKYPNPNSYIRIRGGYTYVQSVASDLHGRRREMRLVQKSIGSSEQKTRE